MRLARLVRSWWRPLLLLLAGLLIAVPLVVLAARWAAGRLSTQVWYVVWYAGLVLDSVPQEIYWTLMVLFFVVLAGLSLIRLRRSAPASSGRFRSVPAPVRELAGLIGDSDDGYYFRWSLSQELSSLVIDAVEGHRPGPADLRRTWFAAERPGVPARIQAYVKEAIWGSSRIDSSGVPLWRRVILRRRPVSPLEIEPEAVVEFIEEQLEGTNDRRRS
jgi:hypothetical protein